MHNLWGFYHLFQKLLLTENYFLIAAINLTTRSPLYTCPVMTDLCSSTLSTRKFFICTTEHDVDVGWLYKQLFFEYFCKRISFITLHSDGYMMITKWFPISWFIWCLLHDLMASISFDNVLNMNSSNRFNEQGSGMCRTL